jgi:Ca-activated chloride channel homolog
MGKHNFYIIRMLLILFSINVSTVAGLASSESQTPGSLEAMQKEGKALGFCPLVHTEVRAAVSGILARVTVTQQFQNTYDSPIEAVYTFPLPHQAAVDDMTIKVGNRVIRGVIKERQEALAIYERARMEGKIAALLNQERPNIFRQYVANILPGQGIDVIISYVETLKYENGSYQFVFPMVVGPRYIPGAPIGKTDGGWSPDTDQVPDASRITPPVVKKGERAGHDISIEVDLDAAVPFANLRSTQHEIAVQMNSEQSAFVRLLDKAVIPNKDFILMWDVAAEEIQDGLVTHRQGSDGYFLLVLQPPARVEHSLVTPKEMVFVLDTSGSMQGAPIEKAIKTMNGMLEGLYDQDTFNVITFSGNTHILFKEPVPATEENIEAARIFLKSHGGSGGTEMMKAIRAALDPSDSQRHLRMAIFMTDGYVGNDSEIIGEVKNHPNARVFSFGIGTSTNRFLLDGMATAGRGVAEYVTPDEDENAILKRFYERIRNPLLTDITLEWEGVPITDSLPRVIPDLYAAQPVTIVGKYLGNGSALVRLRGKMAGREYMRELRFPLPAEEPKHDVLMKLWAREQIKDISMIRYKECACGISNPETQKAITLIGLQYGLMTEYTSFVAVEQKVVEDGSQTTRIEVPVEIPEGVRRGAVFGARSVEVSSSVENMVLDQSSSTGTVIGYNDDVFLNLDETVGKRMRTMAGAFHHVFAAAGKGFGFSRASKFDLTVAALMKKLEGGGSPDLSMQDFVQSSKAKIQVLLTNRSVKTLQLLKDNGFEVIDQPQTTVSVIGWIPLSKLASFAKLSVVKRINKYSISNSR